MAAEKKEVYVPLRGPQATSLTPVVSNRSQPTAPSLYSTRSYVDGHGTYFTEPEPGPDAGPEDAKEVVVEGSQDKPFEVGWDGPDDPMNPKNMRTARKWLVVITLAVGSLCVTCTSSLYTITYSECPCRVSAS